GDTHANDTLTQVAFTRSTAPEGVTALRIAFLLLYTGCRPCRDRNECREPEDRQQDINDGVSIDIGEPSRAIESGDSGLINEERDAEPTLLRIQQSDLK
ncbi:MAG: hypothetical protein Q9183_007939, partial [Haloplaca sp. 2 TL-2023]